MILAENLYSVLLGGGESVNPKKFSVFMFGCLDSLNVTMQSKPQFLYLKDDSTRSPKNLTGYF